MAENTGSSGVSIVAILVVGALILFFAWFFVIRGSGGSKTEIEIQKPTQIHIGFNLDHAKPDLAEKLVIA